jgi:hypothetical protein
MINRGAGLQAFLYMPESIGASGKDRHMTCIQDLRNYAVYAFKYVLKKPGVRRGKMKTQPFYHTMKKAQITFVSAADLLLVW